jgi:TonB family protein
LFATLAAAGLGAHAQATAPAGSASASDASARAQREADKVFQWIRIHSDKPRKAAVAGTPDKPAAPVVRSAARPAAPPGTAIRETVVPLAATPAPRTDVAGRSAPAQAVAVAPARVEPVAPKLEPAPLAAAPNLDEDMMLTPVRKTEPQFPANLMRTLRKGVVQVAFTVQPDGSVSQAHVVSSSHPRLGPTALETVTQWRFEPVRHAQQAVVDLGFNLD